MYCGKCGKKIESTAGVCYVCTTSTVFDMGPSNRAIADCENCATFRAQYERIYGVNRTLEDTILAFRAKLNREKLAKKLFEIVYNLAWEPQDKFTKEDYRKYADSLIVYLKEGR